MLALEQVPLHFSRRSAQMGSPKSVPVQMSPHMGMDLPSARRLSTDTRPCAACLTYAHVWHVMPLTHIPSMLRALHSTAHNNPLVPPRPSSLDPQPPTLVLLPSSFAMQKQRPRPHPHIGKRNTCRWHAPLLTQALQRHEAGAAALRQHLDVLSQAFKAYQVQTAAKCWGWHTHCAPHCATLCAAPH